MISILYIYISDGTHNLKTVCLFRFPRFNDFSKRYIKHAKKKLYAIQTVKIDTNNFEENGFFFSSECFVREILQNRQKKKNVRKRLHCFNCYIRAFQSELFNYVSNVTINAFKFKITTFHSFSSFFFFFFTTK